MHRILAIIERDLRRFRRSPTLIIVSMVMPLIAALLFTRPCRTALHLPFRTGPNPTLPNLTVHCQAQLNLLCLTQLHHAI